MKSELILVCCPLCQYLPKPPLPPPHACERTPTWLYLTKLGMPALLLHRQLVTIIMGNCSFPLSIFFQDACLLHPTYLLLNCLEPNNKITLKKY